MKLADVSINRPVFAAMMTAAIVVFGIVLYKKLNVDMYPEVNFPVVTVTVTYPGASPETMESQVADPIEEAVNSLSGIRTLRSVSMEGMAQVFVEFDLDVPVGTAAQEVRDRVSAVQYKMPDGADLPNVQKLDLGAAPIMQLAVHGATDKSALLLYAEDRLKPALERIRGVGQIDVIGGRAREMHVWLNPEALRAYALTAGDVAQALRSQNVEIPGGRVESGGHDLVVRTDARARNADELGALVLASRDGSVIRIRDVARVEDGFEEAVSMALVDGKSAIALIIRKQSDGNTVKVAEQVTEALTSLRAQAPQGTSIDVLVDNSRPIRASIETVELDLMLGAGLAIAIIFLFLRDPRATFISALALPTSVIGTFGFVKAMGFTLNMMTTLALSLSIGILIDDAIVVIENIVRRRTTLGEEPREAAQRGTAEIGLAVLATTLSIVAVFIPVAFMEGLLGQFFYEFGLTVAFAVMLSLFVSFTLTPMLSSRFLSAHHSAPRGISGLIERVLVGTEQAYRAMIRWALGHRVITLGIAIAALLGTFAMAPLLGFEFTAVADQGQYSVKVELPPGTPLQETAARTQALAAKLKETPGVVSTFATMGGTTQAQMNTGEIIVTLVHRDKRSFHQLEAMSHARALLAGEPNMTIAVEPLQAVSGGGQRIAPVQLDIRGDDLEEVAGVATRVADRMRKLSGFADIDTTYRSGKPELRVEVDRARAADLGINGQQIAGTVQSLIAGEVATQVERNGERYDVRVQLPVAARELGVEGKSPQLRASSGALIDLTSVAKLTEASGPSQINRQGRQRQVTVLANLDGKVLGDAIEEVTKIVAEEASPGVTYDFGGNGKMLAESVASMLLALFLAVICVYMILASQFDSFIHPLTIMSSLPFSLVGALGGLLLMGMPMGIFAMIGLIMLMGLVTKNAILLVDFAVQLRERGEDMRTALENAGATRLRPILMTTGAMVFGMLPVAIGHGDGGEVRAPMGVTVIGGLITSTVLTLVVVPVIYTVMDAMIVRAGRVWERLSRHKVDAAHDATSETPEAAE